MRIFSALAVLVLLGAIGTAIWFVQQSDTASPGSLSQTVQNSAFEAVQKVAPLPMTIPGIRATEVTTEPLQIIEELSPGSNYSRSIAQYTVNGLKINGLLTVPDAEPPAEGFPTIVFLHGYIPPNQYKTTERYVSYVDSLARAGFVVFKIDYRGHGESEGRAGGAYYSPDYIIDTLGAIDVLKADERVNSQAIGLWGHSMSGNVAMRTAVVSPDVQAVVIWAGAVYSYEDFAKYRLNDTSYRRQPTPTPSPSEEEGEEQRRSSREIVAAQGEVDLQNQFWQQMAPISYLSDTNAAIQLHHAENDTVVNIGYSRDLVPYLEDAGIEHELFEYSSGGHDIEGAAFGTAMQRTVAFFREQLSE